MSFPCGQDTDSIALDVVGGQLEATLILSTQPGQSAQILSDGLFVPGSVAGSFPPLPADGDEVTYIADSTNGVAWRFKYRAASSSPYKWEFIGGAWFENEVNTEETIAAPTGSYQDITGGTVGPSITCPLEGDYDVVLEAAIHAPSGSPVPAASIKIGASAPSINDAIYNNNGLYASVARTRRKPALPANTVLLMQYIAPTGSAATFAHRFLKGVPVRVLGGGM